MESGLRHKCIKMKIAASTIIFAPSVKYLNKRKSNKIVAQITC